MKIRFKCFFVALALLAIGKAVNAATDIWTNTAGGDWNNATNWSPNQVPGPADSATINLGVTVTVDAPVSVGNLDFGNATLGGTNVLTVMGTMNWSSGTFNSALTVAQGGILNITNNASYIFNGKLTNNGTVNWSAGNLYGDANTVIYNAGLWLAQSDNQFVINSGSGQTFVNTGTFQKSGGTGTTIVGWNFNTTGMMDIQSGTMNFNSWIGNSVLNGTLTGTASLNSGATLVVANDAVWNWAGSGTLSGALLINSGGVLNITNSTSYVFAGTVTNNGTVNWTAGNLYGNANTVIYNAGLWLAQSDNQFVINSGSGQAFINAGTFQKTGGTGTTIIGWNFTNNDGILDAQTNTISLAGNYDLTGGTLKVGINSLGNYGIIHLSGSPAVLAGTFNANLNNGYLPATNSVFSVLTYSSESGAFTNFNLPVAVVWQTNYGPTAFTLAVVGAAPGVIVPVLTVSLSSGTGVPASASGRFVLASSPVVNGQPQSVAVADVNGDGKVDLMANGLVLTNNGGGFGSNSTYSAGSFGSASVAVSDVNGDGRPDLITANYGNTTLTVLTNNGLGGFGSNATLNVNSSPQCVVAADINGDGQPDLICASSSGARFLTVFTNNGAGVFGLSSTPANGNVRAYSVAVADANGDGRPDLITANFTANTLSVLTNNGGGVFGLNAIYAVGSQPRSVVAADVNGDGKLDLICANAGDGTLTVLTNNGAGGFGLSATYAVGAAPSCIVTADVNGYGPVDLISANEGNGTLTVLTNTAVLMTVPFKNVVLSWPSPSAGFVLQQNSSLGAASWQDVTSTPTVTNGQNQAAVPVTPQNKFFRLLHP